MMIRFPSLVAFVVVLTALGYSSAFQNPSVATTQLQLRHIGGSKTVRGVGNIFEGLFGGGNSNSNSNNSQNKVVMDLPANSVKVGALKFFLQIYLVGEQNKPTKGAWVLNNNDENGSLDLYYKDGTGMFSVAINDMSIQVSRYGERPSLEYMLQESVFLHGILDEINQLAFGTDDIEEAKRLIQFDDETVVDKARETLPARKSEE